MKKIKMTVNVLIMLSFEFYTLSFVMSNTEKTSNTPL